MPETATEFIQEQNTSESEPQQEQTQQTPYPYMYDPRYQPYYYPTPEGMAEYPMMPSPATLAGFRRGRNGPEMGPYFKPTKQICSIYSMDRTRTYVPRVFPRIDRGFFIADNDWTCYRRNYFQVSASFTCSDSAGTKVELPCLVEVEGRGLRTVSDFQLHIMSRTSTGSREVDLVQHTAKRDKGPQITPSPKKCMPTEITPNFARQDPENDINVVWERVQFKTATANNGKRRAAQQYHILFVELLARCDDGYLARVASTESAPLVVRGRAPGHYAAMASKEAAEAAEAGFPYGFPPNDPNSPYYHMMQGYYAYHPYYANPALWAAAQANAAANGNGQGALPYGYMGTPTAEQLAAAAVAAAQGNGSDDKIEDEVLDQGTEEPETPAEKQDDEEETAVQEEQDENEVPDPEQSPSKKRSKKE